MVQKMVIFLLFCTENVLQFELGQKNVRKRIFMNKTVTLNLFQEHTFTYSLLGNGLIFFIEYMTQDLRFHVKSQVTKHEFRGY